MEQRKIIRVSIITVALLFLAIIALAIYTVTTQAGKIKATLTAYPDDSSVTMDGQKISQGTVYITPGPHTFVATKSGFLDDSVTASISEDTATVILLPTPQSAEAVAWSNQPDVTAMRESLGGQKAAMRGASLSKQYPLVDKLPYIDIAGPFALDYGYQGKDNSEVYFILHDSTPDGRRAALAWIRQQGVDPATLDLRYDEFKNPLTQGGAS